MFHSSLHETCVMLSFGIIGTLSLCSNYSSLMKTLSPPYASMILRAFTFYTIRYPTKHPASIFLFRAKAFHTITIYILFSTDVESAQLVLKLDIVHLIHAIWMSDRWPPCILPSGLAKPRPVLRASYWVNVHIRKKDFVRDDSFEMMVQLSFRYMTFLYVMFLYYYNVHIIFFLSYR